MICVDSIHVQAKNPPKKILGDDHQTWVWIAYQLQIRGITLSRIASDLGVQRQTLYQAHWKNYPRMEKGLASALDLQPEELWPHRYNKNGLPIGALARGKKGTEKRVRNCDHGSKKIRESACVSNVNPQAAA